MRGAGEAGGYRGFIARFTGLRRLYNCRGRRVGPFSRGNMAATRATLAGKSRYFGWRVRLLVAYSSVEASGRLLREFLISLHLSVVHIHPAGMHNTTSARTAPRRFVRRTPDTRESNGWRGACRRRARVQNGGESERVEGRGNRDIDSTRDTAGCFRAWPLASSTFDNFDNANYRMTV